MFANGTGSDHGSGQGHAVTLESLGAPKDG
jgi:hypothetical protein